MTNEEVIAILKNEMPSCGKKLVFAEGEKTEAYDMAISAIEKQIPKKVGEDGYGWNECTVCHNHGNNLLSNKFKWCPYCGQKLDWT